MTSRQFRTWRRWARSTHRGATTGAAIDVHPERCRATPSAINGFDLESATERTSRIRKVPIRVLLNLVPLNDAFRRCCATAWSATEGTAVRPRSEPAERVRLSLHGQDCIREYQDPGCSTRLRLSAYPPPNCGNGSRRDLVQRRLRTYKDVLFAFVRMPWKASSPSSVAGMYSRNPAEIVTCAPRKPRWQPQTSAEPPLRLAALW